MKKSLFKSILFFLNFFWFSFGLFAQTTEIQKLLTSDGATNDLFGVSISISGNYAIVGASGDSDNGDETGSAYVFYKNSGTWELLDKLTAIDGAEGDKFGDAVSIYGDYLVIGAPYDDVNGTWSGSIYIYHNISGSWELDSKITASVGASYDRFGNSVSIFGDYIIVGSMWDDYNGHSDTGSAYIIHNNSGNWEETQKITASDGNNNDHFGSSVSISTNYAVIGANNDLNSGERTGSAYIFYNNSGNWEEEEKILASDHDDDDRFGDSVSISDNHVIIGAWGDNNNGNHGGSAYLFHKISGYWDQESKITADDVEGYDNFGCSVSISGDYAIIGSRGNDDNGSTSGSAYVFYNHPVASWIQTDKLLASDGSEGDFLGSSVSISDNNIFVGAKFDDDNGDDSGSAYTYELPLPSISVNPVNQTNICVGNSISFSITGTNIDNYQWQINEGSDFEDIINNSIYSNATTATLNITNVSVSMDSNLYRCFVSNDDGEAISNSASLTIENENPVITSTHNNQTIYANSNCEAILPDYRSSVTSTDNCDTDVSISQSPNPGTTISGNTNTISLTATDNAGNYTSVSFNVDVDDDTNPVITCINNAVRNADSTLHYTVSGTEFDPVFTDDNCGISSVINNYNGTSTLNGESLPEGNISIYWTVSDTSNNSSICSFDVLINNYLDIEDLNQSAISIYPNPTNGMINYQLEKDNIKGLSIFNTTGHLILNKSINKQKGSIDLSSFVKGIYILRIQTDNSILTKKIVKK